MVTKELELTEAPPSAATATTTNTAPEPLEGEALKRAVYKLDAEVRAKIVERQAGVPTWCDNAMLQLIAQLRQLDAALPWDESVKRLPPAPRAELEEALKQLRVLIERRRQGRFVSYQDRFRPSPAGPLSDRDVGYFELITSQGVEECMHWKGVPVFKTVYDFSIYSMMIWDARPRTIVELGSGAGSSAVWMADLLRAFRIDGHVFSVDLKRPELEYEGVSFIQGDCRQIEAVFPEGLLASAPHPWLFVEDAHVNVGGVLSYFHRFFEAGDYVVVEDSAGKQKEIAEFMARHPGSYKLDSRYTDFFGRNATCSRDSIFVRT